MIDKLKKVVYLSVLFFAMSMSCISASATDMNIDIPVIADESESATDDSVGLHNGRVKINDINFPDENFRNYLAEEFDKDEDGYIKVSAVTDISCSYRYNICSMQGIEYFTYLKTLNCDGNKITSLDVSSCTDLISLSCFANELTSLNVSNCTALINLECNGNELTSLDVSDCTALIYLHCNGNKLTSLDVSNCIALDELYCGVNDITSLDLSKCDSLYKLECEYGDVLMNKKLPNRITLYSYFNENGYDLKRINGLKTEHIIDSNFNNTTGILNIKKDDLYYDLQNGYYEYNILTNSYPDIKLRFKNKSITDEPTTEEPTTEEPTTEEPTTEEPTTEEPTTEEPTTDEPTTDEPTTEEPTTDEPTTEEPTTGEPTTEAPTTEAPTTEEPVTPPVEEPTPKVDVTYHTHIQTLGDTQGTKKNGEMAGTSGMAKRLENIWIDIEGNDNLGIQYTTHCQTYGWMPWSCDGESNGTSGEAKRLEAIMIQLTGADKDKYDVYYRVHAQSYGWLGWAKNGEPSGTAGYGKRLEGIQVVVVKKGEAAPGLKYAGVDGSSSKYGKQPYVAKTNGAITIPGNTGEPNVMYKTHVQTFGWQKWVTNGQMSGTSGKAKRLEGINIKLSNAPYDGDIVYTTHVQKYGWKDGKPNADKSTWKKNGEMSGTNGEAKRLEAICIDLTGEMAEHYDVYYRVHAQTFGWLGWAKNGEESGTAGYAKRLEGIQIVLVEKGGKAPADNYGGITSKDARPFVEKK